MPQQTLVLLGGLLSRTAVYSSRIAAELMMVSIGLVMLKWAVAANKDLRVEAMGWLESTYIEDGKINRVKKVRANTTGGQSSFSHPGKKHTQTVKTRMYIVHRQRYL